MRLFIIVWLTLWHLSTSAHTLWVYDQENKQVVLEENGDQVRPIASITKIMTAMVYLDYTQDLDQKIYFKPVLGSRLPAREYTRSDLLKALLVKSDNSAAEMLAADYPGGREEFIRAMNVKAILLGMHNTSFVDPSGLGKNNLSTGQEVNLMTNLAFTYYEFIKETSAKKQVTVETKTKKKKSLITLDNTNSNLLNRFSNIVMSKTGFTSPAGRCVTFVIKENQRLYTIVILGAKSVPDRIDLAKKIIYNLQTGV